MKKFCEYLDELIPSPKCELNFETPFELLVATILSAQCKDERVNEVTKVLFKKYSTPQDFATANEEELRDMIEPLGFQHMRAKRLIELSKILVEKYGGEVPDTVEELEKLCGIGNKTACVVVSEAYHKPAFAVDTHVFRVANRLGIGHMSSTVRTQKVLMKTFPKEKWSRLHLQMVLFGRYYCKSQRPLCVDCKLQEVCVYYRNKMKRG